MRSGIRSLSEHVLQEMTALVGCPAEGITGMRQEDGAWVMTVEVLEMARIPESADVLATYDVQVDGQGQVVEFRRRRRYLRGQTDD
jgi:hypothetical protein